MGVFNFKKFSLSDDGASMKLGTDAVLLGAWADVGQSTSILDIGTGSGIIALMIAQRSIGESRIDAIEMQAKDAQQARENVLHSPWPEKITVVHSRIQDFSPSLKYDLIMCNPPYFLNSLLPPAENRIASRHQEALSFDHLIEAVVRMLSEDGRFCVILPFAESQLFRDKAASSRLFLQRLTRFFTRAGKTQERSLMQFGFSSTSLSEDSLFLYGSGEEWSDAYRKLTRDFYLDR